MYEVNNPTPTPTVAPTQPPTPTFTATATFTSTPTFTPKPSPTSVIPSTATPTATANPPYPLVLIHNTQDGRFGFSTKDDPAIPNARNQPLTFRPEGTTVDADGHTNDTSVWVDGSTAHYGTDAGKWLAPPQLNADGSELDGVWQYQSIVFTETVKAVLGSSTHQIDTFRISYQAKNLDSQPHNVGLRMMIDTLIGDNDGVPFLVPGLDGLINHPLDLKGNDIPDRIQVYQTNDIRDHGVIVQITLKGTGLTPPDRFIITPWCGQSPQWDYYAQFGGNSDGFHQCGQLGGKADSAIGIFYNDRTLKSGETHEWSTYYGLGAIETPILNSQLAFAKLSESFQVGEDFWISVLVQNPKPGQSVILQLPPQLELIEGSMEQVVKNTDLSQSQISWHVRGKTAGDKLPITATLKGTIDHADTQVTLVQLPTPTVAPTDTPVPTPTETPTAGCTPSVTGATCK
ncbi:MAG: hypothetical protein WCF84_09515 [Anaerolineae bacterium]